ncbi:MAG: sensor histidine kinase, partial [Pseudomonadota bacterium]|nr:sensor histidine kinase [Pseudomonadota bacterium]
MRSLRSRLFLVWMLSLAASVALGGLLAQLSRQTATAQVGQGEAVAARACDMIRERYGFYAIGWTGPAPPVGDPAFGRALGDVATVALAGQPGVEGGIWRATQGSVAFAFPTRHDASFPASQRDLIRAANETAANEDQAVVRASSSAAGTRLLVACPLDGAVTGLTAWAMTTVSAAQSLDPLRLGFGVLLGLMLALSASLAWLLIAWSRHLGRIGAALAVGGDGLLPILEPTGERELDRLVEALNDAGHRLHDARRRSEELAVRVAGAERLAALGRMAAGVAHEIRNPIAAMRLKAENALAGDDARRTLALAAILDQVGRLDRLAGELLAAT